MKKLAEYLRARGFFDGGNPYDGSNGWQIDRWINGEVISFGSAKDALEFAPAVVIDITEVPVGLGPSVRCARYLKGLGFSVDFMGNLCINITEPCGFDPCALRNVSVVCKNLEEGLDLYRENQVRIKNPKNRLVGWKR